jgi:hypothetical protein
MTSTDWFRLTFHSHARQLLVSSWGWRFDYRSGNVNGEVKKQKEEVEKLRRKKGSATGICSSTY